MNITGLANPIGSEDSEEGWRSQRRIAGLDFDAAAFDHGGAISSGSSVKVRRQLDL